MTDKTSAKKSLWQSPFFYVAVILSCLFLGFFYLAVTNEPDYMPSQKAKQTSHASHQAASASEPTAAEMNMTEEEHANMDKSSHSSH